MVETRLEIRLTATIFVSGLSVYNNADQLITENGVTYTYDLNGNLKTKTDTAGTTTYTWDYEDRLVKVAGPAGTVTYEYDVDGNRVSSTTSAGTTRYLVDTNRALPQVLAEYTPDGTVLASYTYADDLISMTRGSQTHWYHFDGLGSTRLLTDETGAVTDTYSYDAFGNLIARTGTTQNDFLFTGQQKDANAGFYYLRARWMDPGVGRFSSVDPFFGDVFVPVTLHRYLYANGSPSNFIDPTGQFSLIEISVADSVRSVLVNLQATAGFSMFDTIQGGDKALIGLAIGVTLPIASVFLSKFLRIAKGTLQKWLVTEGIDLAGESADWARMTGMLHEAAKGKGNFGIGAATEAEASIMGRAWVGEGYTVSRDGVTLVSRDELRQFRPPKFKDKLGKTQANFEMRYPGQVTKEWQSNAHLDIE